MTGRVLRVVAVLSLIAGSSAAAPKKRTPKAPPKPAGVPIKWNDECLAKFREDPNKVTRRESSAARIRTETLDTELAAAVKVSDATAKVNRLVQLVGEYKRVLVQLDPYDAQATLGLALAYDQLFRRGCALSLLKRLAVLESHPAFARTARGAIELVDSNPSYFKYYRADALSALGR